jgi:hypothetical protein
MSVFDHIRVECMCNRGALRLNVKVEVQTHSCNNMCVWRGATVEHTQVSSYATPCLRSNAKVAFECSVQIFFFFFYKNKYTKIFTNTKQNIYRTCLLHPQTQNVTLSTM